MNFSEDQKCAIEEAAFVACPRLSDLTPDQVNLWLERAERSGAEPDQILAALNDIAIGHRKGQPYPQPSDLIVRFRGLSEHNRRITMGTAMAPASRLSEEAASDLPMISSLFARQPNGYAGFYGRGIGCSFPKPWPPAGLVEALYRRVRERGSRLVPASPGNPFAKEGDQRREWDRAWCHREILRAIHRWREEAGTSKPSGTRNSAA